MKAHYLNPEWRYNTAASHASADAFRRRQQQRRREAQAKEDTPPAIVSITKRRAKA